MSSVLLRSRFLPLFALLFLLPYPRISSSQSGVSADPGSILQGIDASVARRDDNIASYTVTEHYAVYRGQDKQEPSAEMTVKTTYRRDQGKSYAILSQSGSDLIRRQVLERILDSEKVMTQPSNRAGAVLTTANYDMKPIGREALDGRECVELSIRPRHPSPYLFEGKLWVDASTDAIVKLHGVASKSPSFVAGNTEVSRQYSDVDGYPMATHATAVSKSWLLGQTTIQIDYTGYQLQLRPAQPSR